MKTFLVSLVVTVLVVAAIVAGVKYADRQPPAARPANARAVLGRPPYLGEYGETTAAWRSLTGTRRQLASIYTGWAPFDPQAVRSVQPAVPLIFLSASRISPRSIAAGSQDNFLATYARAVAAYGRTVVIAFDPEMNGNWYSWGYRHTSPAAFVAAWRHIVTLFRREGAYNVIWLWDVNIQQSSASRTISAVAPWWPGASYVTWAGIDGYYRAPFETFPTVFGSTITQIRQLTAKPLLITETAVSPNPNAAAQVKGLFAAVRSYDLLGVVWFNAKGSKDWRLQDDPPALTAFRQVARLDLQGSG
jgi:Glycosyl hydrolase family 26